MSGQDSSFHDGFVKSVAQWYNLPIAFVASLPFEEWVKIRRNYEFAIADMLRNLTEVEKYHSLALRTQAYEDIRDYYLIWKLTR